MSNLTELAEHVLARATHLVNEHQVELDPIWFLVTTSTKVNLIETPWSDDIERDAYLFALRKILEDDEIKLYVQVSEGWSSDEDQTPIAERELAPKQRSNRKEVIIITGCTRDYAEQILWTAPIETLKSGQRRVGAVEKTDHAVAGRMMNLFPRSVS